MGKITAILNQKGGVGKTTVCINLACCLAQKGKRVLVIDLDPQGNATTGLGINKSTLSGSIYNVLINNEMPFDYIVKTPVKNLFLLPSNINLAGAELELVFKENREKCLKSAIIGLKNQFDYILLDCPPSLNLLSINALLASDSVLIPMLSEFFSLEGASQTLTTVKLLNEKFKASIILDGIILNAFEGRSLVSRQIATEIQNFFGDKLFKTVIPKNVKITESLGFGLPVLVHSCDCVGSKAFINLTEEFLSLQ